MNAAGVRSGRLWTPSRVAIDACVALVAWGLTCALLIHGLGSSGGTSRRLDLLGVVLAACASLPLLAWRRWPVGVFVATLCSSAVLMGLSYPGGPPVGATIALYLIAASRDRDRPWTRSITAAVVGLFVVHFAAFGIGHHQLPAAQLAFGALVWAVAWFAGERTRLRRQELQDLRERALQAERDAEQDRRLAVAEERTRIARDLHDSAAHAINVIAVQAGAARLLRDQDPGRSRAALEAIERVARTTVSEIDHIVHTLREKPGEPRGVEPPPGLAAIGSLLAQHDASGLAVTVSTRGRERPLGAAVDQAAYRILQEALTNSARHGAGPASVELAYEQRALELTITNPAVGNGGTPAPAEGRARAQTGGDGSRFHAQSGGHGITGMRERAALLGGELCAERANGAFRVHARLPYGDGG